MPLFDYFTAYRAAIRKLHGRRWVWRRLRFACRCGNELPCPVREAVRRDPDGPELPS